MFPQIPAKLPPAITKGHDVAEFVMSRDMADHDPSGPVALAWRWALTGDGPTPITLMDWDKGPPTRQDIEWQTECPDEWQGRATWDEIRAARSVLWWLTSHPGDEFPSDLLPSSQRGSPGTGHGHHSRRPRRPRPSSESVDSAPATPAHSD